MTLVVGRVHRAESHGAQCTICCPRRRSPRFEREKGLLLWGFLRFRKSRSANLNGQALRMTLTSQAESLGRGSNPHYQLGKLVRYRYATGAVPASR